MQVEVNVVSGRDLKNVNWQHGDLKPYAVLWIDSGPKCTTEVKHHDEDPIWDEKISITLPPTSHPDTAVLYIDIVHANPLPGTKPLVGSAQLPLRDVLNEARSGRKVPCSLKLKRPSGRPHGKLEIKIGVDDHPMNNGKVGPHGQPAYYGYGGPPPQQPMYQYPYGAPAAPPAGYPSAHNYGAPRPPVPVHESPRASTAQGNRGMDASTKFAMGMATKLLGESFKSAFGH